MSYRTILIELSSNGAPEARLRAALALARRFDALLVGMHVMPTPFIPAAYGDATAYLGPELIEAQQRANREDAGRVRAEFERICGQGPSVLWQDAEGDPGRLLARAARTADLVVAAKGEGGGVPDVIEQLLTAAGVPVLMLPAAVVDAPGRTVLAGWNGTREAARALHEALPLLGGAARVVLCAVGDAAAASLESATAMLRRHGVAVTPAPVDQPDGAAGEILLAQAATHGADLLVMGAYGHARLRELVFGGATRHVLRQAALPVMFGS